MCISLIGLVCMISYVDIIKFDILGYEIATRGIVLANGFIIFIFQIANRKRM